MSRYPYERPSQDRPRADSMEWEEASAGSKPHRQSYALWLQLWHTDDHSEWGDLLKETRKVGYDGEII